jgi:hypothetical protein
MPVVHRGPTSEVTLDDTWTPTSRASLSTPVVAEIPRVASHYRQGLQRPCFAHHPKRRGGLHGGSTVLTVPTCTWAGPPSSSPATWTGVQVHSVYYGILSQILAFQVSQGRLEIVCAWSWPCSIFVCSWLSMRTLLEIDSIDVHMLHF